MQLETSGSDNIPLQWLALGRQHMALQMLLLPNQVQDCGDLVAHSLAKRSIRESVLSLMVDQERVDMVAIFKAVYGEDPGH